MRTRGGGLRAARLARPRPYRQSSVARARAGGGGGGAALDAAGYAAGGATLGALDGVHGIDAFEMAGLAYAVAAARGSHGVRLLRVGGDGEDLCPVGSAMGGDFAEPEGAHGAAVLGAATARTPW